MFKYTTTYTDYNDVERTETFYFNFTPTELTEFEASVPGGMSSYMAEISAKKDMPAMMKFFKSIIMNAYGEKSPDGRRMMKSEELSKAFSETPAYDKLFQEIFMDNNGMVNFLTSIMPTDVAAKLRPQLESYVKDNQLSAGA